MPRVQVTLPDGTPKDLPEGATGADLAESIGAGLARAALAVKVDGEVRDLTRPLQEGAQVAHVRSQGSAVFGEDYSDPQWMEAFFGLELAGNRVLVQLAQTDVSPEEQDEAWGTPLGKVLEAAAQRPDLR